MPAGVVHGDGNGSLAFRRPIASFLLVAKEDGPAGLIVPNPVEQNLFEDGGERNAAGRELC